MTEPTLFELSSPGRRGVRFPEPDVPKSALPEGFVRKELPLPELTEVDVVRHFVHLSQKNYAVDYGIYPLGSCTMKYNPKINEDMARLPGFALAHPLQPIDTVQGSLALMYELQELLKEITGMGAVSLQPAAGAHGELTGVLIIRAYHKSRGDTKRTKILIPDSAHGTNPASSAMSGYEVVQLPSDKRGNVDLEALKAACDETVAGLMLTNPNTLGLFEENVLEVTRVVHEAGGLVYGDGANLNALLGIARPGDMGFDILHLNLHKTFSTPHGGGGPGSGPVAVIEPLAEFLPGPIVTILEEGSDEVPPLYGFKMPSRSIGRVKAFHGHFGVMVRAYTYIMMHGAEGLRKVAEHAVLNANYLLARLRHVYKVPYDRICKHEFVTEGIWDDAPEIHALDVAKRLIDYDFHPPTNYFPLIVREALMIEPTETESKQTLDKFADAMIKIAEEAHTQPELLKSAPHNTPVGRLDEVKAAKELVLCCWFPERERQPA
ncbi:aminomethyl-transferring glycine dehydrogenase subunit GcvPB [uncultured Thermanaerothrix sp.]|uniref:aminomethyl-transferring glycine dehydrogenase subunit GcvPB n=1 Tax=uncultured Thermanaerothrix sp. TaxID=1195149 RepID=UPI00263748FE|nr:aminomethyl-transferring glycine dehydrogenase subunit GcvPB [uncultured Thermanaerothrix sp.]